MRDVTDMARQLVDRLRLYGPVAVAFSGGVDSAVVARAAFDAWGRKSAAVTAVSPSLAAAERDTARSVAHQIGIRHVELQTEEFSRPEYRRNQADRCFYCKDTLYTLSRGQLRELGVKCLVNGANLDDLGDHRPGMQAARLHEVRSPLIDEHLTKADVRRLAAYWNLSVADKPAAPCLASRIAYGLEVTEERVQRVERAEALVRSVTGLAELRVRHEANDLARIEVPEKAIERLLTPEIRDAVISGLRNVGFRYVTVDLEGFRSGSLNAALPLVDLQIPGRKAGNATASPE